MKLRAVTLKDVRRFTDPVRIDGIADGVNVLCAPNEFGKSTVFDALRALFFVPYGSRGKEIGQLRPHAGGAPEVSVEIETPEGRFVLSKRWFAKPEARVTRGGVLVAQADEAEAWIARLLGGGDGGPSGLLWVRQGLTSLDEGNTREQQAALVARRDLLSSVTGEVEAMTGGRRMDAALARCREDLGLYATGTGRPRAGGPWAEAVQEVEALTAERDGFAARVATLQTALADRARMRRDLAEIDAPEARAERAARLAAATEVHVAAEAHAARVTAAQTAVQAATTAAERACDDLSALRRAVADHVDALRRDAEAAAQAEGAMSTLAAAESALATAVVAHNTAEGARQSAEDVLRLVQGRAAATAAQDRRADLEDRVRKAVVARQAVEAATAAASVGPDDAAMDRLRRLGATLTTARALRDSTATRVTMHYAPGQVGGAMIGDKPLEPDTVWPIHVETVIRLAGLGDLTVHPGAGPEGLADVAGAEGALAKALAALGRASLEAAGQAHRVRKEAADRLTAVAAELAALAPKGIEDLQRQLAALPDAVSEAADLPALPEAEAAWQSARATAADLSARREVLRERRDAARTAQAEAAVRREAATERLQAARAALDRLAVQDEAELAARADHAGAARTQAEAVLHDLRAAAPDLAATEATLARATSVEEAARKQIDTLRPAIAALTERIAGNSGEAVEERLRETEERLEVAQARLARTAREVRVLQRLQAALEAARSEARDRYFAPVAGELRPLLHLLWPEAELDWADDTLLPQSLIRNGTAEAIDILSGGTQEQIAFLVRLAFARLLAKGGRHAPVILDDALVFTDDDRIERMFDALHRQAGDLQIIVLSCRQRAFRDLGGTVLTIAAGG
ncbi:AAA family ATPase [Roseicyclus mahoneyensis]|uniref:DNA repair exonuclease SbcCD ATPase subunit n=1 Tax=Roseicyclus mahoneyensis TaxID=164332 RepID=A0A316GJS4_9RHOB|nr:ATP-binding protein [Roseicyclus mahoneyensis]PWK60244.1 DNA repair exonuclease SbcCD ATPase subunit [Roseicyclus mahoneyensis]